MNPLSQIEALTGLLPYLKNRINNKIVIKYGGAAMKDHCLTLKVVEDIALLSFLGFSITVIHGGGPIINKWLEKIQITPKFEDGVRITDSQTMEIVQMVLAGKVNKDLVDLFKQYDLNAVGLSGQDANLITPSPINLLADNRVANIDSVNLGLINLLLENKYIPIVAPTASDKLGKSYNINADIVAGKIAGSLKANTLIILTDTPGILKNPEDPSSLLSLLTLTKLYDLIEEGSIAGGMLPKVNCCMQALNDGVKVTRIIDGRVPNSLLLSILTDIKIGSTICH
jgi:acetylglutamate kinase